jgi:hypothetical protein
VKARSTSSPEFQKVPYIKKPQAARKTWQREWTSQKAAATRQYFPTVQDRLRSKIKLTPKITAVPTGHGMTKAYLQRFHLSKDARCKCRNEYQSMNHIIFHCEDINAQRELQKLQRGTWPVSKENLITKYKKEFFVFIESIEFDNL